MLERLKGGLIVSCQAQPDEPLHSPFIMARMALAAKVGGAVGIRACGVSNILEIKRTVDLPVIGLVKRQYEGSEVFITPTRREIYELLESGCEIIAMDATLRPRPNGEKLEDLVKLAHDNGVLTMADISTVEEAVHAEKIGFDVVSTTLAGYTQYTQNNYKDDEPDFEIIETLVKRLSIPVVAEGRINRPEHVQRISEMGLHAIVIGSAITRPQIITASFVRALNFPE